MVAFGLYFFLQWNFDRGFFNYVNKQVLADLEELGEKLSGYYDEQKQWQSLEDNHMLWIHLQRDMQDKKNGARPEEWRERSHPHPPPVDPSWLGSRIMLLDAGKLRVIGGPPERMEIPPILQPIEMDGKTIGYLGIFQIKELLDAADLLFVEQQTEMFGWITLIMLGVSILLTFPVAIHLLRPIKNLTEGTQKLISGRFITRIPVTTSDELGRLSEHFNILAMTLEKNEKARQRWIADISHELRTPLAVVRGEIEALQDGVRKTGAETLDPLHSEVMHMQRLVNDLYELSMSDIGALTYKKIRVDPFGILLGTIELFEQRFADKDLELRITIPDDTMARTLLGDPDRLQQLFTNILENSLRYTDSPGMLDVSAEVSSLEVTISFEDSAPGVFEEQLPLLFDRLFRTDTSRSRESGGAGLGLAICTNIVEGHQGTITSYASPRGGLGIRIKIPLIL